MKALKNFRALGLLLITFIAFNATAQTGEIRGIVTDSTTGAPQKDVVVTLIDRGNPTVVFTDEKGYYSFKPLNPGIYNLVFTPMGKKPFEVQGLRLSAEGLVFHNQVISAALTLGGVTIRPDEYKPIDMNENPGPVHIPAIDFIRNPTGRGINDGLITYAPKVIAVNGRDNKQLSIGGSRPDATQYYVDGVKIIGELNIPQGAIEEVTMISGGLPAKYGDTTSGVVLITTKSFR
ncbi:MAG: TonB-dependent receptor [Sphingobacteriales bacterium JAD_PAG50586_3]|nr:MAG: TonB-dependent receptor [Sphingobacteriales bacterium JAD_PAG50586_3]